jgi:GntR family transcriptional regulator, transcriptional repressor for pyruvate dehydrogenase complex
MPVNEMTAEPRFQSLQSEKLGEQISRQLLENIINGSYQAGDRLPPERELAVIFDVSRVVVREALGALQAWGIISVRHGRGATVNPIDEWNTLDPQVLLLLHSDEAIHQLMETRRIIEPEMAALAAERITDAELEILRATKDLPETDTMEEHVERDINFHLQIAKATHNPVLLMVLTSTSDLLREGRRRIFTVPGELAKARYWHQAIFEAIERRDSEAARAAMANHTEQVRQGLLRA